MSLKTLITLLLPSSPPNHIQSTASKLLQLHYGNNLTRSFELNKNKFKLLYYFIEIFQNVKCWCPFKNRKNNRSTAMPFAIKMM